MYNYATRRLVIFLIPMILQEDIPNDLKFSKKKLSKEHKLGTKKGGSTIREHNT